MNTLKVEPSHIWLGDFVRCRWDDCIYPKHRNVASYNAKERGLSLGRGIRPVYYWVSKDSVLQRVMMDDRKVMELTGTP